MVFMRVDMNVRWINKLSMYKKERVFVMLKLKRLAAMCCAAMLTLARPRWLKRR